MKRSVRCMSHNGQVFNPVVFLIAVNVMNIEFFRKDNSEMFFNYQAMLHHKAFF